MFTLTAQEKQPMFDPLYAGIFREVHPDPGKAPCDGPNMLSVRDLSALLEILKFLDGSIKHS